MTMFVSRWKMMVGVVGVSLGGLAALAGQYQKPEAPRTQRSDNAPVVAEAPKVPPAGSAPIAIAPPKLPEGSDTLALPALPPPPAAPLPDVPPPPKPVRVDDLHPLPYANPDTAKKPDMPKPAPLPAPIPTPVSTPAPTVIPTAGTLLPTLPSAGSLEAPKPAAPLTPAVPVPNTPKPEFTKAVPPAPVTASSGQDAPLVEPTPAITTPATKPTFAPPAQIETKYRIVLRVGEGEPMFEVRQGDDLIMKVKCEKVDIKSPEKGQGLSAVTASGNVRFVGFGAEGSCDSFSFLAGTGEVSMTGGVKVQVKDKIGRIESELTAEKMQYRLDNATLPGMLKP